MEQKKSRIDAICEDNLRFYFDSVRRDQLDQNRAHARAGELLVLQSKLAKMPEQTYQLAMHSIQSLVASLYDEKLEGKAEHSKKQAQQTNKTIIKDLIAK